MTLRASIRNRWSLFLIFNLRRIVYLSSKDHLVKLLVDSGGCSLQDEARLLGLCCPSFERLGNTLAGSW